MDPLSYVFLGCFLFSAVFLAITLVLGGGPGHALSGHAIHTPHVGGHHVGGHVAGGHAAAHTGHTAQPAHANHTTAHANGATPDASAFSPLDSLKSFFLGALNLYGILILLLIFGLLGFLLHNYANVGAELSFIVAIVVGVVCALVVSSFLSRLFFDREVGVLGAESSQLDGRLGLVSMTVRANGVGEVIYTNTQGGRQSMGARSADGEAIATGSEIVILGVEKGIASVQPWDRFMAQVRAGNAPELNPIE